MPRATLADVARLAGVHPGTASRALNPDSRVGVGAQTARRVLAAAKRLDYSPNPVARALRTARTLTVGVLLPDVTNPLFPPMVRGIEDALSPAGYTALVANTDGDHGRESASFAALEGRRVDGFIVATARLEHPLLIEAAARGVRLVLLNRTTAARDLATVASDDAAGVAQAVRHLASLGHTRIAHLAGPQNVSTGLDRRTAFESAMRQAGLRVARRCLVVCAGYSIEAGAEAARRLLKDFPDVTGVVAANDLLALGCIDALAARGLCCPADVSVVGYNDVPLMDRMAPPLTTVRIDQHQLGVHAARLLLELIKTPDPRPRTVILPTRLVVRGSTAEPRSDGRARAGARKPVVYRT